MVIKDIAKIEFDPDNGELWVSSHHIFKPKKQKIVGTVSIIFVQPEDDITSSPEVQDDTIEYSKSKGVDNHAPVNRNESLNEAVTRINSPIQLEIPASLSVIPVPFGGSNGLSWNGTSVSPFTSNSNHGNIPNKSDAKNLDNESYFEKSEIHNADENLTDGTEKDRKLSEDGEQKEHSVSVIDLSGEKCDSEYVSSVDRSVYPSQDCRNLSQPNNYVPNEKNVKSILHDTDDGSCLNVETGRKHQNQYLKNIRGYRQRNPNIRDAIRYSNSSHKSVCYICGENLDSFEKMLDHCSVHKLSKECPVCGVKFSATCNLKRHCLGHVSKIAFSCPVCPALYRRKDNLHVHMQKHNVLKYGMRNTYTKFSNLKRQIHNHTGANWPRISRPSSNVKRPITDGKISTSVTGVKSESSSVASFDSRYQNYDEMEIETDINADESAHNAKPQNTDKELDKGIRKDIKQEIDSPFTGFVSVEGDTMILHKGKEDGKQEKMKNESIINYSCSTCQMKFENLESVKKHAVLYHGEKLPETGDRQLSPELQHLIQVECSSTINSSGSHVITESAKSMESSLEEGLIFSDAQQFSASFTSISSDCDVPDITCLENQTTVAAAADDDNNGRGVTSINYTTGTTTDTLAQSLSHLHSSPSSQNISSLVKGGLQNMSPKIKRNKSESEMTSNFRLKPPAYLGGSTSLSNRRTGIGSRLPVCKFCGQYLDTWEMIIEHLRHHQDILGEKYACVVCATKFSSKDCLRRHAVNHMGIRFQCNICSNAYSRKDNLQKHMKDAHGQYSSHGYPVKLDH